MAQIIYNLPLFSGEKDYITTKNASNSTENSMENLEALYGVDAQRSAFEKIKNEKKFTKKLYNN